MKILFDDAVAAATDCLLELECVVPTKRRGTKRASVMASAAVVSPTF